MARRRVFYRYDRYHSDRYFSTLADSTTLTDNRRFILQAAGYSSRNENRSQYCPSRRLPMRVVASLPLLASEAAHVTRNSANDSSTLV